MSRHEILRIHSHLMAVPTHLPEGHRTIVLIGNSFGLLKRIAFALQRRGHTVLWGNSGRDGLLIAEREVVDLIVCETELPDISGIQICRTVKSSCFFETPVVLVGKLRDEKVDMAAGLRAGADDYIGTFTDVEFVMARLEWLMNRRAVNRQVDNTPETNQVVTHISSLN